MYIYNFEKLEVWKLARKLTKNIYLISGKFPKSEMFGLISQMRRCVISISSNIAEGSGRTSNKDNAHFIQLSYGSLLELLNQLILSSDLNFIDTNELKIIRLKIEELSNKLNSYRNSILNRNPSRN